MLQVILSLLFVSDTTGYTKPSNIFNNSKLTPPTTLSSPKTSPMSTFPVNQRE